ncbi:hypothetical protein SLS62_009155 [Diatrype stigma]|uniref:Uncharacterized protein n=1 Tax=Diatrype stigma TaxID=117547 RepID=A0AAN9YJB5_9PEZI
MSSSSSNTVYVVTGGNRGLGLGLVKALLARPNTTVVATARNEAAVASLQADAGGAGATNSALHVLQFDFSAAIPAAAVHEAVAAVVDHVDVAVLNAGLATTAFTPAMRTTAEDLRATFEVNTIAPLLFFQGLWPLLQKHKGGNGNASDDSNVNANAPPSPPKLAWITSSVGSIAGMEPFPGGAYGPSRAAQNWLAKALHVENEAAGLVAFALHPGWVQTRAGEHVAKEWNVPSGPPVTVEDSVKGMLEVIDNASRETVGGKFVTQTGEFLQW